MFDKLTMEHTIKNYMGLPLSKIELNKEGDHIYVEKSSGGSYEKLKLGLDEAEALYKMLGKAIDMD